MIGFGIEAFIACSLALWFVPLSIKKPLAQFIANPSVTKGGLGYLTLLGIMFLGSIVRILAGYRNMSTVTAEVNHVVFEKNAILFGASGLLLLLIHKLATLTLDTYRLQIVKQAEQEVYGIKQQAENQQAAYEQLAIENRGLKQRINDFERTIGSAPKKAV